MIQSFHTFSPENFTEWLPEPLAYKHQEHYLCFDGGFDRDDDDGSDHDDDNVSIVDENSKILWLCL